MLSSKLTKNIIAMSILTTVGCATFLQTPPAAAQQQLVAMADPSAMIVICFRMSPRTTALDKQAVIAYLMQQGFYSVGFKPNGYECIGQGTCYDAMRMMRSQLYVAQLTLSNQMILAYRFDPLPTNPLELKNKARFAYVAEATGFTSNPGSYPYNSNTQGGNYSQGGFNTQGNGNNQGGFNTQGNGNNQGGFNTQGSYQYGGGQSELGNNLMGGGTQYPPQYVGQQGSQMPGAEMPRSQMPGSQFGNPGMMPPAYNPGGQRSQGSQGGQNPQGGQNSQSPQNPQYARNTQSPPTTQNSQNVLPPPIQGTAGPPTN